MTREQYIEYLKTILEGIDNNLDIAWAISSSAKGCQLVQLRLDIIDKLYRLENGIPL